jgi:oligopeptide transport system permease protein
LAARTLGASDARLIFKHIFPNSLGTIVTGAVMTIPGVIFSESMLSYLHIINLETSSLTSIGTLLSGGQAYLSTYPHIIMFPAIFIAILEIAFNLFGNGLRDALNPSLRGADD